MTGTMFITGNADADQLLNTDGTAVLIGMLLDQQVPMEWAFAGPATLHQRLGHLDATKIAEMDQEAFVAVCCEKPAIHRFPASMGRRIHDVCTALVERFDGRGEGVWAGVTTGDELYQRLRTLPGYGDEKAKIFVAILGKRFGVQPTGWREAAGKFGDDSSAQRRRHHRPDVARQGARVEEGGEGCQEGQAGSTGRLNPVARAELQGDGMSGVTGGGKPMSAVPDGTSGTSSVAGADPGVTRRAQRRRDLCRRLDDTDGRRSWSRSGSRSSSDCEKPYATSTAAITTPTVTAISVTRDRCFGSGSVGSTTTTTLAR